MKVIETKLTGVVLIEPSVFGDHRGWFSETYNKKSFEEIGLKYDFIQDNQSFSARKGTLRGLHYQLYPKGQTKLVRCTRGSIFDVAVDIRKNSPTYGQWIGYELSAENKKQLLVPKGFAHGFMTLVEDTEVQYKVDTLYAPEYDRSIAYNDIEIDIKWPLDITPVLSEKDLNAPAFSEADNNFDFNI